MFEDMKVLRDILVALLILSTAVLVYNILQATAVFSKFPAERWSAVGTVIQALAAIAQSLIACWLYSLAKKQALISEFTLGETKRATEIAAESVRINRQAIILSQRPWLKISIDRSKANSIRWQGDSMLANLWFVAENVGPSPAVNVTIRYTLLVRHFGGAIDHMTRPWPHLLQKQLAALPEVKRVDPLYPNYTIFPKDKETLYQMGGLSDVNHEPIRNVSQYLGQIGADHTDCFAGFILVGVVAYDFASVGERFETGIWWEIGVDGLLTIGRDVECNDFTVESSWIGRAAIT